MQYRIGIRAFLSLSIAGALSVGAVAGSTALADELTGTDVASQAASTPAADPVVTSEAQAAETVPVTEPTPTTAPVPAGKPAAEALTSPAPAASGEEDQAAPSEPVISSEPAVDGTPAADLSSTDDAAPAAADDDVRGVDEPGAPQAQTTASTFEVATSTPAAADERLTTGETAGVTAPPAATAPTASSESTTAATDAVDATDATDAASDAKPSSTPSGWVKKDGVSYYYDETGALATGPQVIDGVSYYFDPTSGAMVTSKTVTVDGDIYYYGADGARVTGEAYANGAWRYFDAESGAMVTSSYETLADAAAPGGTKTVWYDETGAMRFGEVEFTDETNAVGARGAWRFFDPKYNGDMARDRLVGLTDPWGPKTVWYGDGGAMAFGEAYAQGAWRHFDEGNGAMARSQFLDLADAAVPGGTKTVWYGADGAMAFGEARADGAWRYFDPKYNGNMSRDALIDLTDARGPKTVYYGGDGAMRFGEAHVKGAWRFFDWTNGAMARDAFTDLGYKTVYYDPSGAMVFGDQWVDGVWCSIDSYDGSISKAGWQNPSWAFQVSAKSVTLPAWAYDTPYNYVSPSQIGIWASREDCIETFISRAYDYLGTTYWWDAALAPGVGVDCAGLVVQCLYACGMDLGDSYNPADHMYYNDHYANDMSVDGRFAWVDYSDRQRGDLIFYPGHVAIYLGNDTIIEAYPGSVQINGIGSHYGVGAITAVRRPFI